MFCPSSLIDRSLEKSQVNSTVRSLASVSTPSLGDPSGLNSWDVKSPSSAPAGVDRIGNRRAAGMADTTSLRDANKKVSIGRCEVPTSRVAKPLLCVQHSASKQSDAIVLMVAVVVLYLYCEAQEEEVVMMLWKVFTDVQSANEKDRI